MSVNLTKTFDPFAIVFGGDNEASFSQDFRWTDLAQMRFITALVSIFGFHNSLWLSDHPWLSLTHYCQECSLCCSNHWSSFSWLWIQNQSISFCSSIKAFFRFFWEAPLFSHHSHLFFLLNPQFLSWITELSKHSRYTTKCAMLTAYFVIQCSLKVHVARIASLLPHRY